MTRRKKAPVDPTEVLKKNIEAVAAKPEGVAFLTYLMEECGYQNYSVACNKDGEALIHSTLYNEARRALWVALRPHIPWKVRSQIENPPPKEEQETEHGDNDND